MRLRGFTRNLPSTKEKKEEERKKYKKENEKETTLNQSQLRTDVVCLEMRQTAANY